MDEEFITEDSIRKLVDGFYLKVRKDPLLAPVFEETIGRDAADWRPHLEKMYDFWSALMLSTGRYRGNPFQKHKDLPDFDIQLFSRWLELFIETAKEIHTPDVAEKYVARARQIADSLKYGLYGRK